MISLSLSFPLRFFLFLCFSLFFLCFPLFSLSLFFSIFLCLTGCAPRRGCLPFMPCSPSPSCVRRPPSYAPGREDDPTTLQGHHHTSTHTHTETERRSLKSMNLYNYYYHKALQGRIKGELIIISRCSFRGVYSGMGGKEGGKIRGAMFLICFFTFGSWNDI